MSDPQDPSPGAAEDLRQAIEKRKAWFHECHLRRLNLASFREVTDPFADAQPGASADSRLDLVSEPLLTWGFPAGQFGAMKSLGRVYLDDQQPIWTPDETSRHDAFAKGFAGQIVDWLGYRSGRRLAAGLADVRKKFEDAPFSSQADLVEELNRYPRKDPGDDRTCMGRAMSRAVMAEAKPWLIPELYNTVNDPQHTPIENWIASLEAFVGGFESDLRMALGRTDERPTDPGEYRAWIASMVDAAPASDASQSLQVTMLVQKPSADGKSTTYAYDIAVQTAGYAMGPITEYPFSDKLKYWIDVIKPALGEVYVCKPNADMGLCQVIRMIYLLGTLPLGLGTDAALAWRRRAVPDDRFTAFFAQKGTDPDLDKVDGLRDRLAVAQTRLSAILDETATHPRSPSAAFSPLAQEIARQALHAFKFWLDEPLRVSSNDLLLRARRETGIVDSKGELEAEMEYWSENHYIMFASSEFLAGQLWEADEFQPGKEFLDAGSKTGILEGKTRKERGKARLLKWLNNRLMFGWMEFNATGYYREHLWSLLNLVDFSLDSEVREKATVAVDLLLFDVARFLHKGTMGAAGGRSQFVSRAGGWDNALFDVVELLFGARGAFGDADSHIGLCMATSTYQVPEVLLEICVHPPAEPFTDRSRVSVSFEEAPKYGIDYSKKSDERDSVMQGYAAKRERHYPFIGRMNQEITRTHTEYGAWEDDTIFWWSLSAYLNKQNVRNTFKAVDKFGLEKSPIFLKLPLIVKLVSVLEEVKQGIIGGAIGGLVAGPLGGIAGAAIGFFKDGVREAALDEGASDDLSLLLEGSTRTRANILTYRNRDVMLSSIQNFRPGQFNFQSSVMQASLDPSVNVFVNAGFAEIDMSAVDAFLGGGLLGGILGAALNAGLAAGTGGLLTPLLGVSGALVASIANEAFLRHEDLLQDHHDGPGWWTGSWALPMVVQHDSAAILAFDFRTIQTVLAEAGTHAWFPRAGFDGVDEMRTSAYDDANFPLLDIASIGPKGFWVFGRIVHPAEGADAPREAYVGVFSNRRPKWLDQGSDFYKQILKQQIRDPIEETDKGLHKLLSNLGSDALVVAAAVIRAIDGAYKPEIRLDTWVNGAKAILAGVTDATVQKRIDVANDLATIQIRLKNQRRIWPDPLPQDYFAGRDWYVKGKNVWIVQVGNSEEFGDFQGFKDRVSSARIHMDDAGEQECTYDIPRAGGGSERLTLVSGDGGRFSLNGEPFQTDLFPRFENKFLRGNRVEWGQREYVIEYRGKSLLHDLSNFDQPLRREGVTVTTDERNLVKALVIFVKTGDEDMDAFTVATADVTIGCAPATQAQVAAVGPVDENTFHDAEWIFFDAAASRHPYMTLAITHPASSDGDDTPHWKMSFSLFALMGDRIVRPCSLSFASFEFEDEKRTAPAFPFSVALLEWRPWAVIVDHKWPSFWMLGRQPDFAAAYVDYHDLLALDAAGTLWHRRLRACTGIETGWFEVPPTLRGGPDLTRAFFAAAVCAQSSALYLAVQSHGTLFASQPSASGPWTEGWRRIDIWTYPDAIFGLPDTTGAPIPIALSGSSPVAGMPASTAPGAVELGVLGSDGNFYSRITRQPDDTGNWRKIDVSGFVVLPGAEFMMTGDFLIALAVDRSLWAAEVDHSANHISPTWEKISDVGTAVDRFTALSLQGACQIVASTTGGGIRATTYRAGRSTASVKIDLPGTSVEPGSALASAAPASGVATFFAIGVDAKVYSINRVSSSDWTADEPWAEIAFDGSGIDAKGAGGISARARVSGQIELFAQSRDGALNTTWWS